MLMGTLRKLCFWVMSGSSIISKNSKNLCHQKSDFKAKMHQIRFPQGLRPRLQWGSLQCSPDLLAVFKGPTSKRTEGAGEGKGREGKGGEG